MKFIIKNGDSFIEFNQVKFYKDSQDFEFNVYAKCSYFVIEDKIVYANKLALLNFYKQLQDCYQKLKGEVESKFSYDEDIKLKLSFNKLGHVVVGCDFYDYAGFTNKCHIEFKTDQTFIVETLKELKEILKIGEKISKQV